ncbi:Recombinational DNA repair protein (RecE pathway) [Snodgrassella alvi SCGC AB-598-O02]|nr:Recombinational DNA repair protein (RecE pathway) [Snodgrassella alvi SCGC AB-598-O02]
MENKMSSNTNPAVKKAINIKSFLQTPAIQKKMYELVDKNAASFGTSIMQIVNNNHMLLEAEPMSIFNAACMAATLNLPINNNLGFAYIVPYKNSRTGKVEAQFQLGYKGLIQLAQRSGQFERLVSLAVYSAQLVEKDLINGFKFDWSIEPDEKEQPIGFYAYFKLINGFTAELYMSKDQIDKHAKRYSQSFRKNSGVWADNYEQMALKTVTKLLLSRQAPLSIEMQKAVMSDQSVIKDLDEEEFNFIDNEPDTPDLSMPVDDKLMETLINNISTGEMEKSEVLNSNYDFTPEQRSIIEAL